MNKTAIILVDIQNDFINGSLPVENAENIIAPINNLIKGDTFVLASLDYHPKDHTSFKEYGGTWPSHCIQGTKGAELHPELNKEDINSFIYKGTDKEIEAYSAFEGKDKNGKTLNDILVSKGIKEVIIAGLALDVCVLATIKDALKASYKVIVYKNTVEAVNARNKSSNIKSIIDLGVSLF